MGRQGSGVRSAGVPAGLLAPLSSWPLGRCPSGQRELAVNQSALPTEVQILPGPRKRGAPPSCGAPPRSGSVRCSAQVFGAPAGDDLGGCELAALCVLHRPDRRSVVEGKCGSVRVDLGGRRIINKKKKNQSNTTESQRH